MIPGKVLTAMISNVSGSEPALALADQQQPASVSPSTGYH